MLKFEVADLLRCHMPPRFEDQRLQCIPHCHHLHCYFSPRANFSGSGNVSLHKSRIQIFTTPSDMVLHCRPAPPRASESDYTPRKGVDHHMECSTDPLQD